MKKFIVDRMPSSAQMLQVFSLVAFIIYAWAAYRTFWKIPSWILTLTVGEMAALVSYSLTFSFFESLLIFAPLLALCFLIPKKFFADMFVVRASVIVLSVLGSIMIHLYVYSSDDSERVAFAESVRLWWIITFAITIFAVWLLPKLKFIATFIKDLSERTTVFLFIFLPLSAIGLIYVIIRNLFLL